MFVLSHLQFDADGNGHITASEINNVMKALGENVPGYKIRDMIKEVDIDENGTVEFGEFVTVSEIQITSGRNVFNTRTFNGTILGILMFNICCFSICATINSALAKKQYLGIWKTMSLISQPEASHCNYNGTVATERRPYSYTKLTLEARV